MSTANRIAIRMTGQSGKRIFTTDAAPRRSSDTVLNAETTRKDPNMLGRVWAGNFARDIATLSATDAAKARKAFADELGRYSNGMGCAEMSVGAAGALVTDTRPEKVFDLSTSTSADELNGAAAMVFEGAQRTMDRRALSRDVARATARGILPDDLNAINARFWAAQPRHEEKEWGSGK
jgi:hypothetical protein